MLYEEKKKKITVSVVLFDQTHWDFVLSILLTKTCKPKMVRMGGEVVYGVNKMIYFLRVFI